MIYPEYDKNCGWYEVLQKPSEYPPLQGQHNFHTVIIGCGFVGTAAARRLAENFPDQPILLLDALKAGQGASGRNSGFIIDLPHKHELEKKDLNYQRKILRLNQTAINFLENLVQVHNIDCQWSRAGKYQAAVGRRGKKQLYAYEMLMQRLGVPYKKLKQAELKAVLGTAYYHSAIYTPNSILMQPAALMRGVIDHLPENVTVTEEVRVIKLLRQKKEFKIILDSSAEVSCRNIILATNAFTAEFGYMERKILPMMTFASWTRPLKKNELELYQGCSNWGITPADPMGSTVRMTQDHRILIRNGHRYAFDYNTPKNILPAIRKRHRKSLQKRFPELANLPFEHTWGGTGSLSLNHEPFFGEIAPGIYSAGCDQLVGAARGTLTGLMLADLIANKSTEELVIANSIFGSPSKLPPKPVLRLAVPIRLQWNSFISRNEI